MRLLVLLICFLVALASWSPAFAARYALVIGNDAYEHLPKLQKAVNDARAVGAALEKVGFTVMRGENVTERQMQDLLFDLADRLSEGDTVFVFYAGHGVALGGGNHLLPVDTPAPEGSRAEDRVRAAALAEAELIAQLKASGAQLAVVVLDACRDNPFAQAGTRAIGGTRGLARPPEERGVFGIYSAGFGQTALDRLSDDDANPNSVFTRVLTPALAEPGLSLVDIAYRVNEEVEKLAKSAGHEQSPAYYDQARGRDVVLLARAVDTATAVATPAPQASVPEARTCSRAEKHFDLAREIGTAEAYQAFLATNADCAPYAEFAKAFLAKHAGDSSTPGQDDALLSPMPEGVAPDEDEPAPALGTLQRTFDDHSDSVLAVAFSPDGKLVASASTDRTVHLRDRRTGKLLHRLQVEGTTVSIAFSPTDKVLASASAEGARLWNTETGEVVRTLEANGASIASVAFSRDGQVLIGGSERSPAQLWNVASGAFLGQIGDRTGQGDALIALSPDGRILAGSWPSDTVRLWDIATGRLLRQLKGNRNGVMSVAFSPDGQIVAGGELDGVIRLWETRTGKLIRKVKHSDLGILSVAFSPDGETLASGGSDNLVRLHKVATGRLVHIFKGHADGVASVAFSPDGRALASASIDRTVKIWSLGEPEALATK